MSFVETARAYDPNNRRVEHSLQQSRNCFKSHMTNFTKVPPNRNLQKRIRAVELLKSSSLPPSMARRNRCKSAMSSGSLQTKSSCDERRRSCSSPTGGTDSVALSRGTPLPSERSRSSAMTTALPPHGTNLAALLRAQASRLVHAI